MVAIVVCGWAADRACADPLRVGSELNYPPFAIVNDQGQPDGFSIELFKAVADVMDLDYTVEVGPWNRVLDRLRIGQLDALPFVGILPDRAAYLDFSIPIVATKGTAFVRDDGPAIKTAGDLANLRIAVMRDDVGHEYVRTQPWAIRVQTFPSLDAAFVCLSVGACDAVVAPRLQGLLLLKQRGLTGIHAADLSLEGFSLQYAFAVREGDRELLATLNGGLAILIADGTLDRIYRKWLPESQSQGGIPLSLLLPYATAALALFLVVVVGLYMRQRRATRLAAMRGENLERQAEDLRQLAARLETERARAEAARYEADTLIGVMPDIFIRRDAQDRYVDFHDPDGQTLSAIFHDMRGRRYDEVLPPAAADAVGSALERMHRTGENQVAEYQMPTNEGAMRTFETRMAPFADGGSLAVIRDVTEARDREAQLTRAVMTIAEASAAKTRFLATMSHELRTPLNAILGFSEILAKEMFGQMGNGRYLEYAHDIHETGETLLLLVNDLLDIARIESGKLTMSETLVDLKAILEHKAALIKPLAEGIGTSLTILTSDAPVRLWADEMHIQRMVVNLLSNAVKFTPGGAVEVLLENRDTGDIAIVVTDTGVGMTAEQLEHLGEPFYQPDSTVARHAGGTGLGIALVKELIALHGGALSYDSQPGQGTTASLVFPASRHMPDGIVPGPGLTSPGLAGKRANHERFTPRTPERDGPSYSTNGHRE